MLAARLAGLAAALLVLAAAPPAWARAPAEGPRRPRIGGPPGAEAATPITGEITRDRSELGEDTPRALRLARIDLVGREQVSKRQIDGILRREGLVAGAEILWPSDVRVSRARARLRATGYFKSVTIRVEPAGVGDDIALVIDLQERSSVAVQDLWLGSSRMTPFHGGLSVVERNLLGRAVHLGGQLVWGTLPRIEKSRRQQAYNIFVEAPRLGNAPLGMRGNAYVISAAEPYRVAGATDDPDPALFRSAFVGRIGGSVGLTFPVLPTLTMGVDYRFERVDAGLPSQPSGPQAAPGAGALDLHRGAHRLTSAHFGLLWDGRDEVFLAGKGGRIALDLQLSSAAIGSNYEYMKLVVAGAYSFRLPWRHWLTPSISGGQIAGVAPVFEKFYSGDLSAWTPGRELGLRYSTRNPIDVFGTGIGGRTYGVLFGRVDLEYVIPLFRRTRNRGVYGGDLFLSSGVFTLVGDRAERAAHREAGEHVVPIGFNANLGIRLDTALGTFNVSIGNLLRRVPL